MYLLILIIKKRELKYLENADIFFDKLFIFIVFLSSFLVYCVFLSLRKLEINPLSVNLTKWSNTLKQFIS